MVTISKAYRQNLALAKAASTIDGDRCENNICYQTLVALTQVTASRLQAMDQVSRLAPGNLPRDDISFCVFKGPGSLNRVGQLMKPLLDLDGTISPYSRCDEKHEDPIQNLRAQNT